MKTRKVNKIMCAILAGSIASPSLAGFSLPSCPQWLQAVAGSAKRELTELKDMAIDKAVKLKNNTVTYCKEHQFKATGFGALAVTTIAGLGAGAYKLFANNSTKTMPTVIPVKTVTLPAKIPVIAKNIKQAAPSILAKLKNMISSHPYLTVGGTLGVVGVATLIALVFKAWKNKNDNAKKELADKTVKYKVEEEDGAQHDYTEIFANKKLADDFRAKLTGPDKNTLITEARERQLQQEENGKKEREENKRKLEQAEKERKEKEEKDKVKRETQKAENERKEKEEKRKKVEEEARKEEKERQQKENLRIENEKKKQQEENLRIENEKKKQQEERERERVEIEKQQAENERKEKVKLARAKRKQEQELKKLEEEKKREELNKITSEQESFANVARKQPDQSNPAPRVKVNNCGSLLRKTPKQEKNQLKTSQISANFPGLGENDKRKIRTVRKQKHLKPNYLQNQPTHTQAKTKNKYKNK